MTSILMIFIDGVGIGKEDNVFNPFFKHGFKTFENYFGEIPSLKKPILNNTDKFLFPVDACLGVNGFPQSGTGQTSIFCGVNAAELIGRHFGPYPHSSLIPIIKQNNIFRYFITKKLKVSFVNAYPKIFFDYINSGKKRLSVTSLMCLLNEMKLNKATDVRKGNALTAEITNERWNSKLGYKLPIITPETAAERLLKIAYENTFTLYEYFLTDHIGHGRYDDEFEGIFNGLDRFLYHVLGKMNNKNLTLIICSDHGNLEDTSVKTHTFNPALMISAGMNAEKIFNEVKDLTHIKKAILNSV